MKTDTHGVAGLCAAILAGGAGSRLRPAVGDRPKVLAGVGGRPFVTRLLDRLETAGLGTAILCTGHGAEAVRHRLGERYGRLRLIHSREPAPLGTGGALRHALEHLDSETVLVMNGDSFCDVDLADFFADHRARGAPVSMVAVAVDERAGFGAVHFHSDGRMSAFGERQAGAGWINAGVYLVSRHLIAALPADQPLSLEAEVFPQWIGGGIHAFPWAGRFIDIGTPESYARAEGMLGGG